MAGDAVWLDVLPSLSAFGSELVKGATAESAKAGKASSTAFGKAFGEAGDGQQAVVEQLRKASQSAQKIVDAETQGIAKARATQRESAAKLIEAEAKLDAARKSGDPAKVAAAEERLAGARERAEAAAAGVQVAEKRLSTAATARKEAAEKLTKAEGELATKTDKAGDAAKTSTTAFGRFKTELGETDKKAGGFSSTLKGMAGFAIASVGIAEVGAAFGSMIDEAREAEKVGKTTEQIIKATGGASKVSADQIGAFVGNLSEKVGMDDELIQSGANLLLTFKNVRNELGAGNDVFNRATAAAVDLSAAGFGSVEDASKMLGKALNDPAKGITALGRAGVTFSEDQKKAIKQMVATGDVLGAQKLIMKEVESQVGGVAAANSTASERMSVAWGNFKESIGTKLLPVLDFVQQKIIDDILPAAEKLGDGIGAAFKAIEGVGKILFEGDFGKGLLGIEEDHPLVGFLFNVREGIQKVSDLITGTAAILFEGDFKGGLLGVEEDDPLVDFLFQVREGLLQAGQAFEDFTAGFTLGKEDRDAFGDQLEGAVEVGARFREGLELIGQRVQEFWAVAQPILLEVWRVVTEKWAEMQPTVTAIFDNIKLAISDAMTVIQSVIKIATDVIAFIWDTWGENIKSQIGIVMDTVGGIFKGASDVISGIWQTLAGLLTGDTTKASEGIQKVFGGLGTILGSIFGGIVSTIGNVWDGIKEVMAGPVNWVISNVINPLMAGIEKVAGIFGIKWSLPRLNFADGGTIGGVRKVALADGGMMPGYTPGRDVHTFVSPTGGILQLSGGEPVLRPEAGRVLGSDWVDGINAAARGGGQDGVRQFLHEQGFAQGGTVALPEKAARFATGGIIPNANQGFRGYDPGFLASIQAWGRASGRMWYMTGNGGARTFADQLRAWNLWQSGRGPLAANPWRGGPHMIPGIAMDLSPRPGENPFARSLLRQFGLGLTVPGEAWHVGKLGGRTGGVTGGGFSFDPAAMLLEAIGKLKLVTGAGMFGDLLNAIPKSLLGKAGEAIKGKLFDSGGVLPPGMTVAVNNSGRNEHVLTGAQGDTLARLAGRAQRGSLDGMSAAEIRQALEGLKLHVDLDNGEAFFTEHADKRDRTTARRERARTGVTGA